MKKRKVSAFLFWIVLVLFVQNSFAEEEKETNEKKVSYQMQAVLFLTEENYSKAYEIMKKNIDENLSGDCLIIGEAAQKMGFKEEALEYYKKADVKDNGRNYRIKIKIAFFYIEENNKEDAKEVLKEIIKGDCEEEGKEKAMDILRKISNGDNLKTKTKKLKIGYSGGLVYNDNIEQTKEEKKKDVSILNLLTADYKILKNDKIDIRWYGGYQNEIYFKESSSNYHYLYNMINIKKGVNNIPVNLNFMITDGKTEEMKTGIAYKREFRTNLIDFEWLLGVGILKNYKKDYKSNLLRTEGTTGFEIDDKCKLNFLLGYEIEDSDDEFNDSGKLYIEGIYERLNISGNDLLITLKNENVQYKKSIGDKKIKNNKIDLEILMKREIIKDFIGGYIGIEFSKNLSNDDNSEYSNNIITGGIDVKF